MASPPLCRLQGLGRSFGGGEVQVLHGIDLEVWPGDRIRLGGASGAGKTTLLSILGLLDTGYTGAYEFMGREARATPEAQRSRWRLEAIGFAFQDLHLVPSLSARENVALVAQARGAAAQVAASEASRVLAALGMEDREHHLPGALSGGERRRVALARALVNRPRLLLLDEPTAGLDPEAGQAMAALVREAADAGTAVVAASHDPSFPGPGFRDLHLRAGQLGDDRGPGLAPVQASL